MTPITLEECQAEIESLRRKQPDFDELFVDVRDPAGKDIVARLYLQFRDPFSSLRQEGYELTHQKPGKTEKWQYNFSMSESDAARVLHEFNSKYARMDFEPSLSSSNRHERERDEELRRNAERAADEDALVEKRVRELMAEA